MTANSPQVPENPTGLAQKLRNFLVVLIAAILSVALFLGLQTRTPSASLSDLAEAATPLDEAIANGKPTLIEFYANWCTSCQAMAPDIEAIEANYGDQVNFSMLNVDNTKWLPEMLSYRVDGIPHFVFLNAQGEDQGQAIGEIPKALLAENLDALIAGNDLPYAKAQGQVSELEASTGMAGSTDDPRSHGAQVVD
ncbi:MAG: thioredoxin family protein [Cyanobacteria bacterium J06632_22]